MIHTDQTMHIQHLYFEINLSLMIKDCNVVGLQDFSFLDSKGIKTSNIHYLYYMIWLFTISTLFQFSHHFHFFFFCGYVMLDNFSLTRISFSWIFLCICVVKQNIKLFVYIYITNSELISSIDFSTYKINLLIPQLEWNPNIMYDILSYDKRICYCFSFYSVGQ